MSIFYWSRTDIDGNPASLYRVVEETYEEQHWTGFEWVPIYATHDRALNAKTNYLRLSNQDAKTFFPKAFTKAH